MSRSRLNNIIEMPNNTLWCSGNTIGSGPIVLGSNPSRVVFELKGSKRKMEQVPDNSESDPFKPRGPGLDFTQRLTYDIKSHITGYRELFAERAFC